jgi:hypothetical protein
MDSRKYDFLKGTLGEVGASALANAAEHSDTVEALLMPRTVMSWLGVTQLFGWDGPLPGVEDTHLAFSKNLDNTYSGHITVGNGDFPFDDASIIHLAALVSVALGGDDPVPNIKDLDLERLGKNIDVLVKSQYVTLIEGILAKNAEDSGGTSPAQIPSAQTGPAVPQLQAKRTKKIPIPKKPKNSIRVKPVPAKVSATKPRQAPKLPGAKGKTLKVPNATAKSECSECGSPLIKNDRFVGCMCFRDFAGEVELLKHNDNTYIRFAPTIDRTVASAILEALGVK